jgi:hypothetical protein
VESESATDGAAGCAGVVMAAVVVDTVIYRVNKRHNGTGWQVRVNPVSTTVSGRIGPIINGMSVFSCCSSTLKELSRAAAKSAASRLRQLGIGSTHADWARRAEMCERCPLRVVRRGVSYCGDPFLEQIHRDPTIDGCGCPTRAKAKDPSEHCPIDRHYSVAVTVGGHCTCRWCQAY